MELALTPDTRRPVDTVTLAEATRAAGFVALGMVSGRYESDADAILADVGLRCHELLGLQIADDGDATIAMAERLARDAADLHSPWVLTTFRTPLRDDADQVITRCAAICADAGAGLALEFSPLGPVSTIADSLEIVSIAGPARTGIVIDSWNFCFGPSTWQDLEQVPLERVAYLQFADALAPVGGVNMDEAMMRRALPGEGILELDRFATTLRDRGWDGVVSMQVLSDELRTLPVEEYARRVHDSATRYWF